VKIVSPYQLRKSEMTIKCPYGRRKAGRKKGCFKKYIRDS
jgi:hypothetical protein